MNVALPEVEVRYRAMLMQLTRAERLIMGCTMRDTGQNLRWDGRAVKQGDPVLKCNAKKRPHPACVDEGVHIVPPASSTGWNMRRYLAGVSPVRRLKRR